MKAKMTYDEWKKAIDEILYKLYGLDSECLNDWRYAEDYKEGRSPTVTAKRAYKNARWS